MAAARAEADADLPLPVTHLLRQVSLEQRGGAMTLEEKLALQRGIRDVTRASVSAAAEGAGMSPQAAAAAPPPPLAAGPTPLTRLLRGVSAAYRSGAISAELRGKLKDLLLSGLQARVKAAQALLRRLDEGDGEGDGERANEEHSPVAAAAPRGGVFVLTRDGKLVNEASWFGGDHSPSSSDVLLHLFSFCDATSLVACAGVCRSWRRLLHTQRAQRQLWAAAIQAENVVFEGAERLKGRMPPLQLTKLLLLWRAFSDLHANHALHRQWFQDFRVGTEAVRRVRLIPPQRDVPQTLLVAESGPILSVWALGLRERCVMFRRARRASFWGLWDVDARSATLALVDSLTPRLEVYDVALRKPRARTRLGWDAAAAAAAAAAEGEGEEKGEADDHVEEEEAAAAAAVEEEEGEDESSPRPAAAAAAAAEESDDVALASCVLDLQPFLAPGEYVHRVMFAEPDAGGDVLSDRILTRPRPPLLLVCTSRGVLLRVRIEPLQEEDAAVGGGRSGSGSGSRGHASALLPLMFPPSERAHVFHASQHFVLRMEAVGEEARLGVLSDGSVSKSFSLGKNASHAFVYEPLATRTASPADPRQARIVVFDLGVRILVGGRERTRIDLGLVRYCSNGRVSLDHDTGRLLVRLGPEERVVDVEDERIAHSASVLDELSKGEVLARQGVLIAEQRWRNVDDGGVSVYHMRVGDSAQGALPLLTSLGPPPGIGAATSVWYDDCSYALGTSKGVARVVMMGREQPRAWRLYGELPAEVMLSLGSMCRPGDAALVPSLINQRNALIPPLGIIVGQERPARLVHWRSELALVLSVEAWSPRRATASMRVRVRVLKPFIPRDLRDRNEAHRALGHRAIGRCFTVTASALQPLLNPVDEAHTLQARLLTPVVQVPVATLREGARVAVALGLDRSRQRLWHGARVKRCFGAFAQLELEDTRGAPHVPSELRHIWVSLLSSAYVENKQRTAESMLSEQELHAR